MVDEHPEQGGMQQTRESPAARRHRRWLAWLICLLVVFGIWVAVTMLSSRKQPTNLGVHAGQLTELPDSPNCVSSQTSDPEKRVLPIPWEGSSAEAIERLARVVSRSPRSRIVQQTADYLHVEFRSLLFRFVDDVEFFVNPQDHQIELRSASRLGYSDLGVNRKRIEQLRQRFLAMDSENRPPDAQK